jgi:TonB family protein
MNRKTTLRIAISMQIALVSIFIATGFLFSFKLVAQDTKNSTQSKVLKEHQWSFEDSPSFSNERYSLEMGFSSWVASQTKYPSKALNANVQGWVHINYTIDINGTVSSVKITGAPTPELGEAVVRTVKSSPKWMAPKNKEFATDRKSSLNIKFEIPERVLSSQDIPILVLGEVDFTLPEELHQCLDGKMPLMPLAKDTTLQADDNAIRDWVDQHVKYPEKAAKEKIEGTVTIRFIITKSGKLEDFTVVKSIHPLLDAEAIRVLSLMPDWKPAIQEGKPWDVFYYADVIFKLPK